MLLQGHPGSGKTTTLATTIYYTNASSSNSKCLYISSQENKKKIYRVAKNFNMDLEHLESIGRFKFLKIPVISSEDIVLEIINVINRTIYNFKPSVIVVDSITPLLRAIESNIKARSILQNYFYELPTQINGIVILIAEIPFNTDRIELGDIEFVANAILILRHNIVNNLLVRELEIRKARGFPITIARLPFTIVEGSGIRIYEPLRLEEVPNIGLDKRFKQPCNVFQNIIGDFYGCKIIYVEYPLYTMSLRILPYGPVLIAVNRAKTIVFNYKISSKQLTGLFKCILLKHGIDIDVEEMLNKAIELGFIKLVSLNPSAYSVEELYYRELLKIKRFKPDIAIFLHTNLINDRSSVYSNLLRNQLLYLKKMCILTVRFGIRYKEPDYHSLELADIIIRNLVYRDGEKIKRDICVESGRRTNFTKT